MSFYSERLSEFAEMSSSDMFGTTMERNGLSKVCIHTPDAKSINMMPGPMVEEISATFDILRDDWVTLKLGNREKFKCDNFNWQVSSFDDDVKEPTIHFRAAKIM